MSILNIDIQETSQHAEQVLKVDDLIERIVDDMVPYVTNHKPKPWEAIATSVIYAIIHFGHHRDIGCMIQDWRINPVSITDQFAKDLVKDIIHNKIALENKVCRLHPADYGDITSIQVFDETGKGVGENYGRRICDTQITWRSV